VPAILAEQITPIVPLICPVLDRSIEMGVVCFNVNDWYENITLVMELNHGAAWGIYGKIVIIIK